MGREIRFDERGMARQQQIRTAESNQSMKQLFSKLVFFSLSSFRYIYFQPVYKKKQPTKCILQKNWLPNSQLGLYWRHQACPWAFVL